MRFAREKSIAAFVREFVDVPWSSSELYRFVDYKTVDDVERSPTSVNLELLVELWKMP